MKLHLYIRIIMMGWAFMLAAVLDPKLEAASSSAASNITSVDTRGSGWLFGTVQRMNGTMEGQGLLSGAAVEITGHGTRTTDAHGNFTFAGLAGGSYSVTVRHPGFYPLTKVVTVGPGEVRSELFTLSISTVSGAPAVVNFNSPNGRHFIEGMPGNLTFETDVAWNGAPGSVKFEVAGAVYDGNARDLGGGKAHVQLVLPAPSKVLGCSEVGIELRNGEGKTAFAKTGVHFSPIPGIIIPWYKDNIWQTASGLALTYGYEVSYALGPEFFRFEIGDGFKATLDPLAGSLKTTGRLFGECRLPKVDLGRFAVKGDTLKLYSDRSVAISFAGCEDPVVVRSAEVGLLGKFELDSKVVPIVATFIPPFVVVVDGLMVVPVVREVVGALKAKALFASSGIS